MNQPAMPIALMPEQQRVAQQHPLQLSQKMLDNLQDLTGLTFQKTETVSSQQSQVWWNTVLESLAKVSRDLYVSSTASKANGEMPEGQYWGQSLFALFVAFSKDLPSNIRQHLALENLQCSALSLHVKQVVEEAKYTHPGELFLKVLDGVRVASELETILNGDQPGEVNFGLPALQGNPTKAQMAQYLADLRDVIKELQSIPSGLMGIHLLTKQILTYLKKNVSTAATVAAPHPGTPSQVPAGALTVPQLSSTQLSEGGEHFLFKDADMPPYHDVMKTFTDQSRWLLYTQSFSQVFRFVAQCTETCKMVSETLVMVTLFYNTFGKALFQVVDFFQAFWFEEECNPSPARQTQEKNLVKEVQSDPDLFEHLAETHSIPMPVLQQLFTKQLMSVFEKGQSDCDHIVDLIQKAWHPQDMVEQLSSFRSLIEDCPIVTPEHKEKALQDILTLQTHIQQLDLCWHELLESA